MVLVSVWVGAVVLAAARGGGMGRKVFLGGLLLEEHSDHKRVKYFWKLLTSNIIWAILGESPYPADRLPL